MATSAATSPNGIPAWDAEYDVFAAAAAGSGVWEREWEWEWECEWRWLWEEVDGIVLDVVIQFLEHGCGAGASQA